MLPLAALISAAVVDGALLGRPAITPVWTAWTIVGGLAALVIAALAAQVRAAAAEVEGEADDAFAAVDGQTGLIAAALVIAGVAVFLVAFAPPRGGAAFAAWAGVVAAAMGFTLAIGKCVIGGRRTPPAPGADAPASECAPAHCSERRWSEI